MTGEQLEALIHRKRHNDDMCKTPVTIKDEEFRDGIWRDLELSEVIFINCEFHNIDFYSIEFAYVIFYNCTFSMCDFLKSEFQDGVMFYYGRLDNCKLDQVRCLDDATFMGVSGITTNKGIETIPIRCPDSGGFIGWKKCPVQQDVFARPRLCRPFVIVKLYIPAKAKRISGVNESRKCRASEAKVLGFYDENKKPLELPEDTVVRSMYDWQFEYTIGKTVKSYPDFDDSRESCGSGIHFFLDFKDAVNYLI